MENQIQTIIRPRQPKWKTGPIPFFASAPTNRNGKPDSFHHPPYRIEMENQIQTIVRPYQQKWKTDSIPFIASAPTKDEKTTD
jgi:hypothetical protein